MAADTTSPLVKPPLHPLQPSIRLLEPDRDQPSMSYSLTTYLPGKCPNYKALSYSCGSPCHPVIVNAFSAFNKESMYPDFEDFLDLDSDWETANHRIIVNGCDCFIRLNLYDALWHLWRMDTTPLWVDAICINADDHEERVSQVALMAEIYGQADAVIAWLGKEGQDSRKAEMVYDKFHPIYTSFEEKKATMEQLSLHDPKDPTYLQRYGLSITLLTTWFSWICFFRRAYFGRSWTLQGQILGKHLQLICGFQTFDWQKLRFLVKYFKSSGWQSYLLKYIPQANVPTHVMLGVEFAASATANVEAWEEECLRCYSVSNLGTTFCEALYRTIGLDCFDPRDKIHSMAGLLKRMSRSEILSIEVDYSIEVADLYQQATMLCLASMPDLTILSLIQHSTKPRTSNLPS